MRSPTRCALGTILDLLPGILGHEYLSQTWLLRQAERTSFFTWCVCFLVLHLAKVNSALSFRCFIQTTPSTLLAFWSQEDGRKRKPSPPTESVYTFLSISYSALSVILNVYLTMLQDLLSFLGLMFAKHPVTSTSTDNFLLAAKLPSVTHRLETLNRMTKGSGPQQRASHNCVGAHEVRVLSGAEKKEGLWSWKPTWNSEVPKIFGKSFK